MRKLIIWNDAAFILIDGELHYQILDNHNQINVAFDDEYDWKSAWRKYDSKFCPLPIPHFVTEKDWNQVRKNILEQLKS